MEDFGKYSVSGSGNSITFRPFIKDVVGGVITFGLGNALITINLSAVPTKELIVPLTGESDSSKIVGFKTPYHLKKWYSVNTDVHDVTKTIYGTVLKDGTPPISKTFTCKQGNIEFFEFEGGEVINNGVCSSNSGGASPVIRNGATGLVVDDLVMGAIIDFPTQIFYLLDGKIYKAHIDYMTGMPHSVINDNTSTLIEEALIRAGIIDTYIKELSVIYQPPYRKKELENRFNMIGYSFLSVRLSNGVFCNLLGGDDMENNRKYKYEVCDQLTGVCSLNDNTIHNFKDTYALDINNKVVPFVDVKPNIYLHKGRLYEDGLCIASGASGGGKIIHSAFVGTWDWCCYPRVSSPEAIALMASEECTWNWTGKGVMGSAVDMSVNPTSGKTNW